jgi:hypothetical protein
LDPSGDALIGYWEDAETFHVDVFDIGTQTFLAKFEKDTLQIIVEDSDFSIACKAATP